jgi:flagellar biogenesis protein FliO
MQNNIMAISGGLFVLVYLACVIGVIVYVLWLLSRFVRAHERVASALEIVARKSLDGGKP